MTDITTAVDVLTASEEIQLAQLEDGIRQHVEGVGVALRAIRDGRLYRVEFSTFEDYCRARWGINRQHANRQIRAAEVNAILDPTGSISIPEAQARELVPVLIREGDAAMLEAFHGLQADHGAENVTARGVRVMVRNRLRRAEREAASRSRQAAMLAAAPPDAGLDGYDLRVGRFQEVLADVHDGSVDAVVCDPPYEHAFLPELAELAELADRVLAPDGVLAVLYGHTWLPDAIDALRGCGRPYRWIMSYSMPGPSTMLHARRVHTHWKPVLLYGGGGWIDDVVTSEHGASGELHRWGQDELGMSELVRRLTLPGALVCDPVMGAGTTALGVMAAGAGRTFIGCDVGEHYVTKARERIRETILTP